MLFEFHTHTTHSRRMKVPVEGLNTPEQMVRHAKKIGLGALAITDHDEIRGALEAMKYAKKYGVVVVPGIEVTTRSGHLVCLGVEEKIKHDMSVDETIDAAHSQGGITIGVHPFDINNDGIKHLAKKADAVEVFNAINIERITNRKAQRYAQLWKKPQVAGSDAHCVEMLGHGVNEISDDADSVDKILKAVSKGCVDIRTKYIPAGVIMRWSVTRLKMSYPFVLDYINTHYTGPKKHVSRGMLNLVRKSPGRVDYFFKALTYFSLGSTICYTAARQAVRK
jgi:hypothetical protein